MPAHEDYLLSRKEVAEQFGISKRFLELAVGRADGPSFVRIGRLVRYRIQDVLDWINRNTIHP